MAEGRAVVITGLGAITPLGNDAGSLFERWCAGELGIEDGVAPCREFEPRDFMTTKEVRRTDRFSQFALAAAQQAVDQAGWDDGPPYDGERVGCLIGTGFGGFETMERQHEVVRTHGIEAISPLAAVSLMPNAAASSIAIRMGLKGPSHGVASACAAGADAIGCGLRAIAAGDADAVVAGGSEASLTKLSIAGTDKMGALSKVGISRPFDARRDGFVMGEGGAAVVLEAKDLAERRGAPILAELAGYGATTDAYHLSSPDPSGGGAARAIARALEDAGVKPDEVDYVNAHGTSTPLNDRTETNALKQVLGDAARRVPVSSTKSVIGHLIGGAGAAEAVATILALRARVVPPTMGYGEPDEGLDLDYVPNERRLLERWPSEEQGRPVTALSNSFGFGGQNAVLCLRVQLNGRNGA